jgi:hypothetical protein
MAPGVVAPSPSSGSPEALFDIQFGYNVTDSVGRSGMAAVAFVNNEYWVSRWQNDTLYKFNANGQYLNTVLIPGLTGVRSLTFDGTYLFAGTNTTTIYRIDPSLATLAPPHITVNATVGNVRHCSYDATLNSNAGGFWVGNFNTNLFAISTTGTVLNTINATTHGLTGMYGSAYDPYSSGGPFLWVFAQMAPSNCMLYRVQLSTGQTSPISHDVMTDIGVNFGLTSGLAGGLFITNQAVVGQNSMIGLVQGTPDNVLFSYELSDPVIPAFDAKVSSLRPVEGYTRIPLTQVFPESFEAGYANMGRDTLDTVYIDFEVRVGANVVFNDTQTITGLLPNASGTILSTPFSPANGVGTYNVTATARLSVGILDSVPTNNQEQFSFQVTDSVYARDNNVPDGGAGYSVNAPNDYCFVTANYTLYAPETLSAVWIRVASALTGDTTRALVANTISGVTPDLVLAQGSDVIMAAGTNEYLLPIPNGLNLAAGTYAFGCYQGVGKSIKLAQTADIYTPNTNFFVVPGGTWTSSGIQTARFIRPVFGTPVSVSTSYGQSMAFEVYPNPGAGKFFLRLMGQSEDVTEVLVSDIMGKTLLRVESPQTSLVELDLKSCPSGLYFVSVSSFSGRSTKQLVISR